MNIERLYSYSHYRHGHLGFRNLFINFDKETLVILDKKLTINKDSIQEDDCCIIIGKRFIIMSPRYDNTVSLTLTHNNEVY